MNTPKAIILIIPCNLPALEEFCDGMDVTSLEVYGHPGFGFFREGEDRSTVEFLLSRGLIFRLLTDVTPPPAVPSPPCNSPASSNGEEHPPRGSPDGAEA